MYTEQDLTDIREQQKRRWIALTVPCVVMAIAAIAVLIIRGQRILDDTTAQIIVDVLSVLIAFLLIGGYGLMIKPLHCYEKHLNGLLHGITHEIDDCTFARLDQDISLVDGVRYYALTVTRLDEKQKPYEQLFYFDAEKDRPSYAEGTRLRIVYHDRAIGAIQAV